MITREELSDFVEFCQAKYHIELNSVIIEDFIKTINSEEEPVNDSDYYHDLNGCSSNNIECTHLTFDSAKCNECPY